MNVLLIKKEYKKPSLAHNSSVVMSWSNYLHKIWYDPEHIASFTGPDKLYRIVKEEGKYKIGRHKIKQWLQDQDSYGLSRNLNRHFPRTKYVVNTIDSLWEIDLADFSSLKSYNDNHKYLLVIIDVFSRSLWIQPIKERSVKSVIAALKIVFSKGRKPKSIRSDKGSEFKNKDVRNVLLKEEVNTYYSQNEAKCAIVERVIRTIKSIIYRYFRDKQTYKYIDVIQDFVTNYNNRPHRSLGQIKPNNVNKENANEVRYEAYLATKRPTVKKEK